MKTLSREEIQRMVGRQNSRRNVAGNNQESSSQGFATPSWVDENYLSKSFFSTLFIIHATQTVTVTDDQGQPVGEPVVTSVTLAPNEVPGTSIAENTPSQGYTTTTVIALESIEATTNFYSDGGVSALGQSSGGGGGGASALTDLVDVAISSPTNGQVLMYNSSTGKWYNGTVQSGGGGTVTSITAGTGLSGGTITNSGTIGINSTYQSYITHGETAYGWGNHAGAGYLKSITSSMVTTALGYTPLSNATTFWGQTASSGVVSGDMTSVGSITMTGNVKMNRGTYISFRTSTSSTSYLSALGLNNSKALLIGVGTASVGNTVLYGTNIKFVSGSSSAVDAAEFTSAGRLHLKQGAQGLRIGDALLTWDSTNKVLNLTNTTASQTASFAASGGVSALGLSSEGNGGRIQNLTVTGTLTLGDTVIANKSPSIVRQENASDCLSLLNTYTVSKDTKQKYYYNQYDNVGLLGTDYTHYNTTWWIDPDGCALFKRVYLSDNVYLYTDGSNIKVRIGSTVYTLTKS